MQEAGQKLSFSRNTVVIQIEDEICQATVNDCFMSAGDNLASSNLKNEDSRSPGQNVKENG